MPWLSFSSEVYVLRSCYEPSRPAADTGRQFFFLMNLAFNAVMWGLFTRALTLASSTVRVSVINTSANFGLSAVLGALIFSEGLPGISPTSSADEASHS